MRYATEIVRAQLTDKDLRLVVHLAEPLPPALADVEKTTWVLINLLSNAIRYSPHGAALTIRAVPWGEMVQAERGRRGARHRQGVSPAHFPALWGVVGAAWPPRGSSGLGLSISREFITAQGGQLWVRKPAGRGQLLHVYAAGGVGNFSASCERSAAISSGRSLQQVR
ncbi:MAG: ATP-binding protein [Hymenobacter sp.]